MATPDWRETGRRVHAALVPHRFGLSVLIDSACWVVAIVIGLYLRFDLQPTQREITRMLVILPVVLLLQFALGSVQGLYVGRFSYGSFEEVAALAKSAGLTGAMLLVIDIAFRWVPLTVTGVATVTALVLMAGARYSWRLWEESQKRPSASANRVVVFGAGDGGRQIITALLRDPASRYLPVALVDDDPRKQQLRVKGVPVQGTRRAVSAACGCEAPPRIPALLLGRRDRDTPPSSTVAAS